MSQGKFQMQKMLTRYGTILALIVLCAGFSFAVPGFLAGENGMNILRQIALLAVISEGFTMCLIVGELDLAFPHIASLSGALVAGLIFGGMAPLPAVLLS
ncbi:MAG TPA: hypothetical protein P5201_08945, partial [Aminobacteriaceae bacterium]|nr:hypothetical protein [Aminobacteriaceae bacterium]